MTREEKEIIVNELSEKLANTNYFYITDASTMSVATINQFRRMCFDRGLEYKVYKNTLIKKALDTLEADTAALEGVLKGASGILFSPESGNAPAKLIQDFRKKGNTLPLLKGAYIDAGLFVGNDQLDALSKIKSKAELIGDVIGMLQSPAKNVVSALQSGGGKLAGILKTLSEKE
ncbi:LSU ribosomal protein L10P [Pontibacter ummariensis]|uniref:Large ribosomal subunit protein uL10 n=1 Tax=Pontibacter ummariensis TaxID=1610492 RepID=A0A239AZA6_9BACT|nr:50S ribosomal protein L10 [Pontibacter ummariensis]PRY16187.1 LSU ribosomal protein L10P [Pontibacter ummariensis]SNS00711.1 LSU ribosomal protein L10P [Pontibacter ummariensis]